MSSNHRNPGTTHYQTLCTWFCTELYSALGGQACFVVIPYVSLLRHMIIRLNIRAAMMPRIPRCYGYLQAATQTLPPPCYQARIHRSSAHLTVLQHSSLIHTPACGTYIQTQKKSYPITGLDKPFGLQEAEAPRISIQSRNEDGKAVSPTHRPPLTPSRYLSPGTYFY
jgi:hypothetical protein